MGRREWLRTSHFHTRYCCCCHCYHVELQAKEIGDSGGGGWVKMGCPPGCRCFPTPSTTVPDLFDPEVSSSGTARACVKMGCSWLCHLPAACSTCYHCLWSFQPGAWGSDSGSGGVKMEHPWLPLLPAPPIALTTVLSLFNLEFSVVAAAARVCCGDLEAVNWQMQLGSGKLEAVS